MYNKEEEKRLIIQYQQTKDPMLLRKLRRMFAGTIQHAVQTSNTFGLDQRSLDQKALFAFKNALDSYEPGKSAPNSHITNRIQGYLRNENTQFQNTTRLSSDDTALQNQYFAVKNKLETQGIDVENNKDLIIDEINKIRTSKKVVNNDWLEKVKDSSKKNYSGDKLLGEEGKGEDITFMDVLNTGSTSAEEEYEKKLTIDKFKEAFDKLTPQEQHIYIERNPGVFNKNMNKKKLSWNYIALNNNLPSGYIAEKKYNEIEGKLRSYVSK